MSETAAYWQRKLAAYHQEDWSSQPSLFVQAATEYFPKTGRVLELGAGLGQDGNWLMAKGYDVIITDLTAQSGRHQLDMAQPLPFGAREFDVIYAHLSLHYFSFARTQKLFDEIYQCLKPGGVLAFLVNSVHDPEADKGENLEPHFQRLNGIDKRFFDLELTKELTQSYTPLLLDDHGTSYKDQEAGMERLIRFVGRKNG